MDVFALTMRLKTEGTAAVDAALSSMRKSLAVTTKEANRLDAATGDLSGSFRNLAATLAAGFGAREMMRIADSWTNISARLAMVTKNTDELAAVQGTLFSIAQATRQSFEEISTLYLRVAQSAKSLGLSQAEVLQLSERVAQAVALSGADPAQSAAAIQQLAQAFANGAVQAQEWSSIAEQTPRLAIAIAESFGMTTDQFRKAVLAGQVASRDLSRGILANTKLAQDAAKLPTTISGAFTQFRNEIGRFVNAINKATGASQLVVNVLNWIRDNLPTVTALIVTATGAWVAYRAVLIGVTATQTAMAAATAIAGMSLTKMFGVAAGGATAVMVFMEVASRLEAAVKGIGKASTETATAVEGETLKLSGNAKAGASRLEILQELAAIAPITQTQANELRAEYDRLTGVLNAGNISLQRRLDLEKERVAIADAMAAATVVTPPSEVSAMERRMGRRIGEPMQAGFTPPSITQVNPRIAEAARQSAQRFGEVVNNSYAQEFVALRERLAVDLGMTLADALAAGIETAIATGSIGAGFKTLAQTLLRGLGDMMIQFGKASLVAAGFMDTIFKSLAKALPGGAIVASLAMIAAGAALKGAAGAAFGGGGRGGGGGGISMPSFATGSGGGMMLPGLTYAPTAAGSAATIQQVPSTNITIIGPNDPSAQRQMQELMRNAQRRGEA